MRRFHHAPLPQVGQTVTLEASVGHHLRDVLRLRPGTRVLLFDGAGGQCVVRVDEVDGQVTVTGIEAPTRAAPVHPLHLWLGLPKGPAGARAVRMATEAGATVIQLVQLHRVQVKGDPRPRLERVTAEAARQCGRADVPELPPVARLEALLEAVPPNWDRRVAVPGAERLEASSGPAVVLVGPEGGLTPQEVQQALDRGFRPLGLGQWVFRAETAAGVAVALTAP